jgi:chromosome segregation ATPase
VSNEDVVALEEELAGARTELEALRESTADRAARAAQLETQMAELRAELSAAREAAQAHEGALSAANERAAALEERVRGAALRYRELVLRQSPELPEELVAGESIEEIEEALTRARETVAKVRGHIESEAQAGRVPVGAPARSGPDLSTLSADEKIRLGLEQGGRS